MKNSPERLPSPRVDLGRGDVRRPTVEEVLSAAIPGRKESVAPAEEHDPEGFSSEALYRVPAPGVHPRIFFSPEDLPRLRRQLTGSPSARAVRERVESLFTPGSWENLAFEALAARDLAAWAEVQKDERNPYRSGPPGGGSNPFPILLQDAAFLTLLDDDAVRGKRIAVAAATYGASLRPLAEEAARKPGAEHYWLSVRHVMGDGPVVALLYDYCGPWFEPKDRESMRELLAFALGNRYGLGMDQPRHFRNWNFMGMGLYFPLMMLALEGEKGFDPRVIERGAEVARDYVLFGNSALGTGKEAVGYHTAGMLHTADFLLALAQRGRNYFTLKRWRAMFSNWLLWTLQPWGGQWSSSGDLGNFGPNRSLVRLMTHLFPKDPQVAMVARNLAPDRPLDYRLGVHMMDLLFPFEPGEGSRRSHADVYKTDPGGALHPLEKKLSQFDEERGVLWARSGWGPEDASLHFAARNDATFPSHDFADRGAFHFSALGVPWSVPGMREIETKYHAQITVDGRGQGYFAPPATWLSRAENELGSFASVDLKYCWDWFWMKPCFVASEEQFAKEPWLAPFKLSRDRLLERFPLEGWERDDHPKVKEYYEGFLAGDPRMWGHEDTWVVRHPHFPVEKAFRTAGLVRGRHPYMVILDDMRVDGREHDHRWRMPLAPEMEAYSIVGNDVTLGLRSGLFDGNLEPERPWHGRGTPLPKPGQPLLLVKTLEARHDPLPTMRDNASVEAVEIRRHADEHQFTGRSMGLGRRLSIPSRSAEPAFKMLLLPYRHGEPIPQVLGSVEANDVRVVWPDQVDKLDFRAHADGRTRFSLEREGARLELA